MTPVQLPEVPEFGPIRSTPELHAALKHYATLAVMAERARVASLADSWRSDAAWLESTPMADTPGGDLQARTFRQLADELSELLTQPEQNSGR